MDPIFIIFSILDSVKDYIIKLFSELVLQ